MDGLNQLNSKHELFKTIRGKGLLIGAVLEDKYSGRAGELSTLTMQEGLMTLVAGPNVHRFAPPLVISDIEIDEALDLLDRAYSKFNKKT
jgi:acetylornithine/succinyldiaminopimelate/putrescine aminotransferase